MRAFYTCFLLFISFFPSFGKELKTILFQDIQPKNQVLELTFPPEDEGMFFAIGAYRKPNDLTFNEFFARAGTHHYEMRHLDNWNGTLDYIVTDLSKGQITNIRLVKPSLLDEFDLLLSTDELSPMTVNFLRDIRFFSYPFTIALLIFNIFLFILLWALKRTQILKSLLISCLVTFILMDARNMIRHSHIISRVEKTYPSLPLTEIPHSFLKKVRPLIKEGPWTFQGAFTVDYYQLFIKQQLANIPYVHDNSKGTFVITENPTANQKILLALNEFYLAQEQ